MRHYLKYTLFFLLGFLLLFLILNFRALVAAKTIYTQSLAGKASLEKAVALVEESDFKNAGNYAAEAEADFSLATKQVAIIQNNFLFKTIGLNYRRKMEKNHLLSHGCGYIHPEIVKHQ